MINHTIENPGQFVLPKERHIGKWIATGVGSVALAALAANGLQSDPKFDMKNNAQLTVPVIAELSPGSTQEYDGPTLTETIKQDEITGLIVEREAIEFAEIHNIQPQQGQSTANFLSAESIENAVRQVTGGSVQPGTKIETRLDPQTGYIISTYVPDITK